MAKLKWKDEGARMSHAQAKSYAALLKRIGYLNVTIVDNSFTEKDDVPEKYKKRKYYSIKYSSRSKSKKRSTWNN